MPQGFRPHGFRVADDASPVATAPRPYRGAAPRSLPDRPFRGKFAEMGHEPNFYALGWNCLWMALSLAASTWV